MTAGSDFSFGPNYIGIRGCFELNLSSPKKVLTHAARAAAKQLNKLLFRWLFSHLGWPRAARAKGSG